MRATPATRLGAWTICNTLEENKAEVGREIAQLA
jgi:hypothetical protein